LTKIKTNHTYQKKTAVFKKIAKSVLQKNEIISKITKNSDQQAVNYVGISVFS
jgi:hypothetical protein